MDLVRLLYELTRRWVNDIQALAVCDVEIYQHGWFMLLSLLQVIYVYVQLGLGAMFVSFNRNLLNSYNIYMSIMALIVVCICTYFYVGVMFASAVPKTTSLQHLLF